MHDTLEKIALRSSSILLTVSELDGTKHSSEDRIVFSRKIKEN